MGLGINFLICSLVLGFSIGTAKADDATTATTPTNTKTQTTKTVKKKHRTTVAQRRVASDADTAVVTADMPRTAPYTMFNVSASPGMTVSGGAAAFTFDFGATVRPLREYPLHIGANLGVDLYGGATGFHFLPTAYWVFDLNTTRTTRFTAGLSIGPTIISAGGITVANGLGTTTVVGGASTVYFEMLLKPGVEFDVTRNFMVGVNPNFGIIGANFAFVPQVSGIYTF